MYRVGLVLSILWACAGEEEALTGDVFNLEYEALYCATALECAATAECGDVILLGDPFACEFDSDQGRACLDADWVCESYLGDRAVVETPVECLHVFAC